MLIISAAITSHKHENKYNYSLMIYLGHETFIGCIKVPSPIETTLSTIHKWKTDGLTDIL